MTRVEVKDKTVYVDGHEIGTAKHRFDADLTANILRRALGEKEEAVEQEVTS
jgi:hypothetical protein